MVQETGNNKPHISVAPMMDWTNRHYRYFARLISPHAELYTEMVTTGALIHGDADRFLRFDDSEHPVILQLGGSNPDDLARCSAMGEKAGYDAINLNCGCPSDRVQNGRFGACLMKEPAHVADCFTAMQAAVDIPVTIKCRIGVDDQDDQQALDSFVDTIADKGCKTFIIHARKAWLKGLSPKENRDIPPLNYERVYALKEKFPELNIQINGGIKTVAQTQECLQKTDGVMIGREAYSNPYILTDIERAIFNNSNIMPRADIAKAMVKYAIEEQANHGTPIKSITRHIIGLYHGMPGARQWRRTLSTLPYQDGADERVILEALNAVENHNTVSV